MPNRPYVPGDETKIMTIQHFIAQEERLFPDASGGRATDGKDRLMDFIPTSVHERIPVLLGSTENVLLAEEFISGKR